MNLSFRLFFFCFALLFRSFLFPTSIRMRVSLNKKKTSRLGLNGRKRVRGRRSQKKKNEKGNGSWRGEASEPTETPPTPCVSLLSTPAVRDVTSGRIFFSFFFFNQILPRCTSVVLSFRNKQEHTHLLFTSFVHRAFVVDICCWIVGGGCCSDPEQTPPKPAPSSANPRRNRHDATELFKFASCILFVFSHTQDRFLSQSTLMWLKFQLASSPTTINNWPLHDDCHILAR